MLELWAHQAQMSVSSRNVCNILESGDSQNLVTYMMNDEHHTGAYHKILWGRDLMRQSVRLKLSPFLRSLYRVLYCTYVRFSLLVLYRTKQCDLWWDLKVYINTLGKMSFRLRIPWSFWWNYHKASMSTCIPRLLKSSMSIWEWVAALC